MTDLLFDITFWFAAPFWALMILAPGWRRTSAAVASPLICLPSLVVYAVLILPGFSSFAKELINPSLLGLQAVLGSDVGAAAAWAHFVAFDLFLGRWIFHDSRARGLPALLISPLLALTILFAPVGVLLYLITRSAWAAQSRLGRPAPQRS
ncbi:ABA4-like family protein [Nocardia testacea]|uniref:ABA4-like family protein n=1 Tax=Nocardia testacea TaxID=248551 RepID=UPI0002FC521D|nr:ABA4-like family protein [Nocardia testacea]